jgi:hypothetical protein
MFGDDERTNDDNETAEMRILSCGKMQNEGIR